MAKTTLQRTAYEIIKTRIINCEYKPGKFLNTLELQDALGFSRTPIREALGRLEQEKLVKFHHKKGFAVSDISLDIINTIYETRMLIEPHIVANYASMVDKLELERMRKIFTEGLQNPTSDEERYMRHDDEFHILLRSACPNPYLLQVLENIASQSLRVRRVAGYQGLKLKKLCEEHLAITSAILDDDLQLAGKIMYNHLTKARKYAFSAPGLAK